jgi:nitrite reductase (NADH) small subunit
LAIKLEHRYKGLRSPHKLKSAVSGCARERLYALDNYDPFAAAFVVSRGIVGDKNGVPVIASPIYKNAFDLRSGQSLDDPAICLRVWSVRVRAGRVEVET